MDQEIAKSFALIMKVGFFVVLGLVIWLYAPPGFWEWLRSQVEWAVALGEKAYKYITN